jgi:hypothetical protein
MKRTKILSLVVLATLLFALGPSLGSNPNPGVATPNISPRWAQAWWTWAAAIPAEDSPLFVDTNEAAQTGQSEGVFLLAGALDGLPHVREITVPAGTPLLFPVVNSVWWAPDDLGTAALFAALAGLDPAQMTENELLRFIAAYSVQAYETQDPPAMSVTVDGVELADVEAFRAASPQIFELEDTDLLGDLPDRRFAADGYWVFLNPLKPGEHTIHIVGAIDEGPFAGFTVDVTYEITVVGGQN